MYQVPVQHNVTQFLSTLDKCTQIIRQDRIWLRNQIKANSEEALYLFKGLTKNPNMKQLQIKIRKYIHRVKQQQKHEQLLRFKQNMGLPQYDEGIISDRKPASIMPGRTKPLNLIQNQSTNERQRSSFVAKWNQYSHHQGSSSNNLHLNNFLQNRVGSHSQVSLYSQQKDQLSRSNKKDWINNYKPHSFNKSLNGQLANKLHATKNRPASTQRKLNDSGRALGVSRKYINQKQDHDSFNITQNFGQNTLNNTKNQSLKQLQSKIYAQLRQFQNKDSLTRSRKTSQYLNKTSSQHSLQKSFDKDKCSNVFLLENQKSATFSKQSIGDMLKHKLGNCDYQVYKKNNKRQNQEEERQFRYQPDNQSHKKMYNEGLFPPIEQQTERDSQSQRYFQEPLRFGVAISKQATEDDNKFTMNSFAKASPQQFKETSNNWQNSSPSFSNKSRIQQIYQKSIERNDQSKRNCLHLFTNHLNHQQTINSYIPKVNEIESRFQSDQKSERAQEMGESKIQEQIMNSIRKSRQQFPSSLFSSDQKQYKKMQSPFKTPNNIMTQSFKKFQNKEFISSSKQKDEQLFTSPQLLNECRNFLKKTQQINFQNSGVGDYQSNYKGSKYQSPVSLNSVNQRSFNFDNSSKFPQPITITQSITKDFYNQSQSKVNLYSQPLQFKEFKSYEPFRSYDSRSFQNSVQIGNDNKTYDPSNNINMNNIGVSFNLDTYHENSFKKSEHFDSSIKKDNNNLLNKSINVENKKQKQSAHDYFHKVSMIQSVNKPQSIVSSNEKTNDAYSIQKKTNDVSIQNKTNDVYSIQNNKLKFEIGLNNQTSTKKHEQIEETLPFYQAKALYGSDKSNRQRNNPSLNNFIYPKNEVTSEFNSLTTNQDSQVVAAYRPDFQGNYQKPKFDDVYEQLKFQENINLQAYSHQKDQLEYRQNDQQEYHQNEQQEYCQNEQQGDRQNESQGQKLWVQLNTRIQDLTQLQDIIDSILQATQGNIEFESSWLLHTLENPKMFKPSVGNFLKNLLKKQLSYERTYNFIEIASKIQSEYKKNKNYQPRKCPARDIYFLLDIEQKGYITENDIKGFIDQLEQAQVENIQEIRHNLLEVFELADFLGNKTISYINLYTIKNEQIFDKVCQDLQQFEFEIQAEQ